jgi:hypothetical protein
MKSHFFQYPSLLVTDTLNDSLLDPKLRFIRTHSTIQEQLSDYLVLNKDSARWNQFLITGQKYIFQSDSLIH